ALLLTAAQGVQHVQRDRGHPARAVLLRLQGDRAAGLPQRLVHDERARERGALGLRHAPAGELVRPQQVVGNGDAVDGAHLPPLALRRWMLTERARSMRRRTMGATRPARRSACSTSAALAALATDLLGGMN